MVCVKADMIPLTQVIAEMLRSEPVGVATYVKALWRSQKRFNIELLCKYANMVDPAYCAVDSTVSSFAAWEDQFGNSCAGMRHKKDGTSHGVIRAVKPSDWVIEGTYKDGKAHGLVRSMND